MNGSSTTVGQGMVSRLQAARALLDIFCRHETLGVAVVRHAPGLTPPDKSMMQAMCYGVMRWYPRLDAIIEILGNRKLRRVSREARVLLQLGLYQLIYMRVPAYAALNATIDCASRLGAPKARGFINAVLRSYQRRKRQLEDRLADSIEYRTAHPVWLVRKLQQDWPQDWTTLCDANNHKPPMILRVNLQKTTVAAYCAQLDEKGLQGQAHSDVASAVVLQAAVNVEQLPGFAEGLVSVQDAAAQYATTSLACRDGERVLDACAAPGGKTAHILQSCRPQLLHAMDSDRQRLQRMQSMFLRIGKQAELIEGDAARPGDWWDKKPYDRILLDAPCSASGVIRRHPDIKYHRDINAVQAIVRYQRKILDALWPLLRAGGTMLYVTCSVFKVENEQQVSAFLDRHADARLRPVDCGPGVEGVGCQILTGTRQMDGFYFARLEKCRG